MSANRLSHHQLGFDEYDPKRTAAKRLERISTELRRAVGGLDAYIAKTRLKETSF